MITDFSILEDGFIFISYETIDYNQIQAYLFSYVVDVNKTDFSITEYYPSL